MHLLAFVAGGGPIGGAGFPVRGARGGPLESGMRHEAFERPFDVARVVACEAQFGARFQHPR